MRTDGKKKKLRNSQNEEIMGNLILVGICGLCFGLLAASGVLTVLTAVGLVPRYVGRMHEAGHILLFENMIIWGTMAGTFVSLFGKYIFIGILPAVVLEILYGFFAGIFVGTLALAIAEMLDSFPIFFRRVRLGGGLRIILLSVALGKMTGAFLYFFLGLYHTVQG